MIKYDTKKIKEVTRMMKVYKKGGKTPYATNDPSPIKAPHDTKKGQPNASVIKGGDLRAKGK